MKVSKCQKREYYQTIVEVNEGFLQGDVIQLNEAAANKLAHNLSIRDQVQIQAKAAWKSVNHNKQMKEKPHSNVLKGKQMPYTVKQNNNGKHAPCFNCGERNHTLNVCVYNKRMTCHRCGMQGHKAMARDKFYDTVHGSMTDSFL